MVGLVVGLLLNVEVLMGEWLLMKVVVFCI